MYIRYNHHGEWVWVRKDLQGKHREHCLCYSCEKFLPHDKEKNCPIANVLYSLNVAFDLVTPVWECKNFVPKYSQEDTDGQDRKSNQICD